MPRLSKCLIPNQIEHGEMLSFDPEGGGLGHGRRDDHSAIGHDSCLGRVALDEDWTRAGFVFPDEEVLEGGICMYIRRLELLHLDLVEGDELGDL